MSLLTLIQQAADRIGISRPAAAVSSTDPKIRQLIALANEEGLELANRSRWTSLVREATFTTLAAASQGAVSTIASGFDYIIPDTFWDRDSDRRVFPITGEQWQAEQASVSSDPYFKFRIWQGNLYLTPTPTAGINCAFEYVSKNWCQSSGGTGQSAWAADTDTGVLDERLMTAGLVWRWKKAKNLDFGEDFNVYERLVNNAIVRDGAMPRLNFSRRGWNTISNANVKEGSW